MHPLPHVYTALAEGAHSGSVELSSATLSALPVEPPPQFGGEGRHWSPEGLLCAAVASCFILSFRAVARAARLEWRNLECKVDGTLQREDGVLRFTHLVIRAALTLDSHEDAAKCRDALERAERGCLIANSLCASRELRTYIVPAAAERPAPQVIQIKRNAQRIV
jgi:organic hydroperoxide reductase OsmC/OhrA